MAHRQDINPNHNSLTLQHPKQVLQTIWVTAKIKKNCYSAHDYRGTNTWNTLSLDTHWNKSLLLMSQEVCSFQGNTCQNQQNLPKLWQKVTSSGNRPSTLTVRQTAKETTVIRLYSYCLNSYKNKSIVIICLSSGTVQNIIKKTQKTKFRG